MTNKSKTFAGPINIRSVLNTATIPAGNQIVIVHMNVSASNVREEYNYFITVTPSVESGPTSFTTENSTFQLSVLYNQEYTVSVVANNCAGNSTPVTTTFNISKLSLYLHYLEPGETAS